MTNTSETAREQFEIVRRGYEPQQVDRKVSSLANDLQAARKRVSDLERRLEEIHVQGPLPPRRSHPTVRRPGSADRADPRPRRRRVQGAARRRDEETDQHRSLSEQAADKVRAEAERYAQERRSEADAEAARVLEDARRQADQLRDSTERDTKARREEAEALFESNRAKAAQAAADFESTLAQRRDQAERDYTEQMKANENQLSVVAHRAEQLRLEAEKLRADADRKSQRTLDEAQRQADEMIGEAKAVAERIRSESERELSAATQRRDSINAQLTNVRQMLATLTGATLPNPFVTSRRPERHRQPAAAKGPAGPAAASMARRVERRDERPEAATPSRRQPRIRAGSAAVAKPGAPADAKPACTRGAKAAEAVDTNMAAAKADAAKGPGQQG